MRPTLVAPVILASLLLAASPVQSGSIKEPPEPPPLPTEPVVPTAVLYSLETGLVLLVSSDFELGDFPGDPFPSDLSLVDLDDLTHGTPDAYALTQLCVSDPLCRDKILGSGRSGRQTLAEALVNVYPTIDLGPPKNGLPVPEPGTAALMGLGLGALAIAGRRAR